MLLIYSDIYCYLSLFTYLEQLTSGLLRVAVYKSMGTIGLDWNVEVVP